MQLQIKFKSITTRWFLNIFLVITTIIVAFVAVFSILFGSIYNERIKALATDYSYEFHALSQVGDSSFYDAAISIAGSFQYKDKIEVQVLDTNSNVIVSTTGFQTNEQQMPDYFEALNTDKAVVKKYTAHNKEKIMAGSNIIYDTFGKKIGVYRWITSMSSADRLIINVVIIISAIGLAIISFCAFSGIFFIKSIIKPIRDVSNTARKIAMGDFESKIEFKKNDEIGELCDTINYMASELSQAENMKNDFISSVSHELRTPLTAIRGWGETAKMSVGTDEELVKRGLDVVLNEAERLSGLVEELLDFSRMETGRMTLTTQPLNVSKVLLESVDMYVELARQQGIEVVYSIPEEEMYILGDADRLKQVFINIIDNAVKYTESGGQVLVNMLIEEACVRIEVSDTGVGIAAADIDRVKEKFYKANKTVRGSGIGLAVADEIIKQHQGLLFIESTEGAGTTVTIVLPVYEEETEVEIPMEELIQEPPKSEINTQDQENNNSGEGNE